MESNPNEFQIGQYQFTLACEQKKSGRWLARAKVRTTGRGTIDTATIGPKESFDTKEAAEAAMRQFAKVWATEGKL